MCNFFTGGIVFRRQILTSIVDHPAERINQHDQGVIHWPRQGQRNMNIIYMHMYHDGSLSYQWVSQSEVERDTGSTSEEVW